MKRKKVWKKILIIAVVIICSLLIVGVIALHKIMNESYAKQAKKPGNATEYDLENIEKDTESPLDGKKVLFLGSSVTKGQSAMGISFVDYLDKKDGVKVNKQAVSATTLVDEWSPYAFIGYGNGNSYLSRLRKVDTSDTYDCVVCQLSTNDATMGKELGVVSDSKEIEEFDTKTIIGAMEYIIAYSEKTWNCPVVFYTGSYYENDNYEAMVNSLFKLQEKWGVGIIDMYTDQEFNDIPKEEYDFYMADKIHPTKAGYLKWWLPKIEEGLQEAMN